MNATHLPYLIFIGVLSWIIGWILHYLLKKRGLDQKLGNLNFINSEMVNQLLGVKVLKWLSEKTFFKHINKKLKISGGESLSMLEQIKQAITHSEINHLLGFIFILVLVTVHFSLGIKPHLNIPLLIVNVLFNLYPILLRQYNKRQISQRLKMS